MRIALTTDSFVEGRGGVSTAVAALARSLRLRRHETMIYTAADPSHEELDLNVVGLRALRYERFPGGRAPLAPVRLVRELAEFQPDVIHNHSMGTMGIQALVAARLLGIPILGTCHVLLAGFLRYAPISIEGLPLTEDTAWRYTVTFFNRFPQVTVPSRFMKEALLTHGLQAPVDVVSNGVDTSLFRPGVEVPTKHNFQPTVIHVGRLSHEKRVGVLLRAFALLTQTNPESRLIIAGDGPEMSRLHDTAKRLGVLDRVQFVGHVPHDLLPALYQRADIFVTASTIETQGLVVLEAMACGLPVVGVRAAALTDAVQDEVTGFLVPPNDAMAIAQALARLIAIPEMRMRMGREARKQAESQSLQFTAANYEILYQTVREQTPRRLLPQAPVIPKVEAIWTALRAEVKALVEEGVECVMEIVDVMRDWAPDLEFDSTPGSDAFQSNDEDRQVDSYK